MRTHRIGFVVALITFSAPLVAISAPPATGQTVDKEVFTYASDEAIPTTGRMTGIAVDAVTGLVYAIDFTRGVLLVIDGSSDGIVGVIDIGGTLTAVSLDRGVNSIFVADSSGDVVVIDATTRTIKTRTRVGAAINSLTVDPNPDNHLLYVTHGGTNGSLSYVDTLNNTVVARVAVGAGPWGIAFDTTNNDIYVANSLGNSVSVVEDVTRKVILTIHLPFGPAGLAFNSKNRSFYAANMRDQDAFAHSVSVIDGATHTVTSLVEVGRSPQGVAIDQQTQTVYVTNSGNGTVSVIDAESNVVTKTLPVGGAPQQVALDPRRHRAWVTNGAGDINVVQQQHPTATFISDAVLGTQQRSFTATVASRTPLIGGTVTFFTDDVAFGECFRLPLDSTGHAICTPVLQDNHTYSVTARYDGAEPGGFELPSTTPRIIAALPPRVIALGDSLSAGEGVPPFQPRTAVPRSGTNFGNECHRSLAVFQFLVDRAPSGVTPEHWGCTGAVVADFYRANTRNDDEPPQLDVIGRAPLPDPPVVASTVTLNVGVNDIKFSRAMETCVSVKLSSLTDRQLNDSFKANCQSLLNEETATALAALGNDLTRLYADIRARTSDRVFVVGYPRITVPGQVACDGPVTFRDGEHADLLGVNLRWTMSAESIAWINKITERLNHVVQDKATDAGFLFVDTQESLLGHSACVDSDSSRQVHGVVVRLVGSTPSDLGAIPSAFSFHPKLAGQRVINDLIEDASTTGTRMLRPGQLVQARPEPVKPGTSKLTVSSAWRGGNVSIKLRSPSGRLVDPADSDVHHLAGETFETFSVSNPDPGQWTADVIGGDNLDFRGQPVQTYFSQIAGAGNAPLAAMPKGIKASSNTFTFEGRRSAAITGDLTDYSWDFGDGTPPQSGAVASHSFAQFSTFGQKTYAVKLTVRDSNGRTDTASQDVTCALIPIWSYPTRGPAQVAGRTFDCRN